MSIFDFLFGNNDGGKKEEVDEILEMIYDDPEYDEFAAMGAIPSSKPPNDTDEGQDNDESDDDDGPTTDKVRTWWWPF